jgi:hypothetical protein
MQAVLFGKYLDSVDGRNRFGDGMFEWREMVAVALMNFGFGRIDFVSALLIEFIGGCLDGAATAWK